MDLEPFPSRTPSQRLAYLQGRLAAMGLDAYWVVDPANVRYLSGFTGDDSTLLVSAGRSVLVTDSRYEEQACAEAAVDEIECRRVPMAACVATLCRKQGVGKLGLAARKVVHADWDALSSALPAVGLAAFQEGPVERMRVRKSREELESIMAALEVAQAAFGRFSARAEPGRSERWLAALLEWEMKSAGADDAPFETICAVDERASLPHAGCTDRPLVADSALLVDWGARVGGYCCDLTRVVGAGTMPACAEELAQVVVQAQEAACERLGPGVPCCEVDRAARAVIARAGYGRYFGHATGHGVGLEVHEAPRLGAGVESILLPGMVVTVEPGIYLPGVAGVRIEDVAVITPRGCELLSSLDKWPAGR